MRIPKKPGERMLGTLRWSELPHDPPTHFIFVCEALLRTYRSEFRAILQRFPVHDVPPEGMGRREHESNLRELRQSAIADLRRATVEALSHGLGGIYPLAI